MPDTDTTLELPDALVGTVLDERYQLLEEIGRGGVSVVYKAKHLLLSKDVAIKVLQAHLSERDTSLERFRREIQTTSSLHHPNIVGALSSGTTSDGRPYLATEFVEGESLASRLKHDGSLDVRVAIPLFLDIAEGLRFAHEHGIVHRDIKPSNIMLATGSNGKQTARIVDFGLAFLLNPETADQRLTKTSAGIPGSPAYMSPEQCTQRKADKSSDIYSLGCLMYEVLTGAPPFSGDSPLDVMYKQMHSPAPAIPKELGVPPAVEALVLRCLRKSPEERFDSTELISELSECTNLSSKRKLPGIRLDWKNVALGTVCGAVLIGIALGYIQDWRLGAFVANVPFLSPAAKCSILDCMGDNRLSLGLYNAAQDYYSSASTLSPSASIQNLRLQLKLADIQWFQYNEPHVVEIQNPLENYKTLWYRVARLLCPVDSDDYAKHGDSIPEKDAPAFLELERQLHSRVNVRLVPTATIDDGFFKHLTNMGQIATNNQLAKQYLNYHHEVLNARLKQPHDTEQKRGALLDELSRVAAGYADLALDCYRSDPRLCRKYCQDAIDFSQQYLAACQKYHVTGIYVAIGYGHLSDAYYLLGEMKKGREAYEAGRKIDEAFPVNSQLLDRIIMGDSVKLGWEPLVSYLRFQWQKLVSFDHAPEARMLSDEAIADYEKPGAQPYLKMPSACFEFGINAVYANNLPLAVKLFERTIELSKNDPSKSSLLGATLAELGYVTTATDVPKAVQLVRQSERVLRANPSRVRSLNILKQACRQLSVVGQPQNDIEDWLSKTDLSQPDDGLFD